jgi:ribosomal subunit interface protein
MQLIIQGKQIDVGDALRTHVSEKLEDIKSKYFNRGVEATVTFSREGSAFFKAHISIRIGKNILVIADDTETEPYAAFDTALAKVAKQLRRYKNRLRDHHERLEVSPETEIIKARDYVLATTPSLPDEEEPALAEPVIVAEMTSDIESMSVSEAVMRMDLAGQNVLLFRDPKHNSLNIVYRRADGNVGWIDAGWTKAKAG